MFRTSIFIAIFLALGARSELLFSNPHVVSGAFLPSLKTKYGVETITEDAFVTAPQCIVVADGLSGIDFNTGFLANFLAKYGAEYILDNLVSNEAKPLPEDELRLKMNLALNSVVETYNEDVDEAVKVWAVKNNVHTEKTAKSILSASTFVAAFLKLEDDEVNLNIVQKGDSMVVVFRMSKSGTNPGRFYYAPIWATPEMQLEHNAPYQFQTKERSKNAHIYTQKVTVQRGDLVLVGSDGLFDNVHVHMLTFMINYLVAAAQTKMSISKIISELTKLQKWFKIDPLDVDPGNFRGNVYTPEKEIVGTAAPKTETEQKRTGRLLSRKSKKDEGPSGFGKFISGMFGCGMRDDKKDKTKESKGMPSIEQATNAKYMEDLQRKRLEDETLRSVEAQNSLATGKYKIDAQFDMPYKRVSKVSARNFGNMTPAQIEYYKRLNAETDKALKEAHEKEMRLTRVRGKERVETWDVFAPKFSFFKEESQLGEANLGSELNQDFILDSAKEPALKEPFGGPAAESASISSFERDNLRKSLYDIQEESEGDKQVNALLDDDEEDDNSNLLASKMSNLVFNERIDGASQIFTKASQAELFGTHPDSRKNNRVIPKVFTDAFDKHFDFSAEEMGNFGRIFDAQKVSYIIAKVAKEFSECKECLSPFRVNSFKYGKSKVVLGGKKDDITVVLNMVMNIDPPSQKAMQVFRNDILNRIDRVHRVLSEHVAKFMDHYGA